MTESSQQIALPLWMVAVRRKSQRTFMNYRYEAEWMGLWPCEQWTNVTERGWIECSRWLMMLNKTSAVSLQFIACKPRGHQNSELNMLPWNEQLNKDICGSRPRRLTPFTSGEVRPLWTCDHICLFLCTSTLTDHHSSEREGIKPLFRLGEAGDLLH